MVYCGMQQNAAVEKRHKLLIEVDVTEALARGQMAPGYTGNNDHEWSEEQRKFIEGWVLRRIGELIHDDTAGQPCIDYASMDDLDMPEGMFGSFAYDDDVQEGSEDDNLMCAQESMLGVALAVQNEFLEQAKARGMEMATEQQTKDRMAMRGINVDAFIWSGECHKCRQQVTPQEQAVGVDYSIHAKCQEEWDEIEKQENA